MYGCIQYNTSTKVEFLLRICFTADMFDHYKSFISIELHVLVLFTGGQP